MMVMLIGGFYFDVCLAMLTETDGRGGVRDVPISVSL